MVCIIILLFVAQEPSRSKAPLVVYIPYHLATKDNFLGDIYIAQEMLAKREVKLLPFLPAQLKKDGEEASQRGEAEFEERLNVIALYY